jgi:hypothetical protein
VTNTLSVADVLAEGIISPFSSANDKEIIVKMDKFPPLKRLFDVNRGIHAYRTDGYGKSKYGSGTQTHRDKDERSYHASSRLDSTYLPEVKGKDVFWMDFKPNGEFVSYGEWLAEPREPKYFMDPKIVVRKVLGKVLSGAFISEPAAIDQSLYILIAKSGEEDDLRFALGVLLSKLGAWYLRNKHSIFDLLYPWYTKKQLCDFPLPPFNQEIADITRTIERSVLKGKSAKTELDRRQSEKEIAFLEKQLNERVLALYKLTEKDLVAIESQSMAA